MCSVPNKIKYSTGFQFGHYDVLNSCICSNEWAPNELTNEPDQPMVVLPNPNKQML